METSISYHPIFNGHTESSRYSQGFRTLPSPTVTTVSRVISRWPWSSCLWTDGRRLTEKFSQACWAALDFDQPDCMKLEEAVKHFSDKIHIIGTTKSHQRDKGGVVCDRYRVLLLFAKPIDCVISYRYNIGLLIRRYKADAACKDCARFFWPCGKIISVKETGKKLDILTPPKVEQQSIRTIRTRAAIPRWMTEILINGVPSNKRSTMYRVTCELKDMGYGLKEVFNILSQGNHGLKNDAELWGIVNDGFRYARNGSR